MNFNDKVRAMALRLIGNNDAVKAATEPKVYVALLTQTGTDAPVATVLKNTLGVTPVWTYTNVGVYNYLLPFNVLKTFVIYTTGSGQNTASQLIHAYNYDDGRDNLIEIITKDGTNTLANELLINFYIKIEVYP